MQAPGPIGRERAEGEDEHDLAELRGLDLEERQREPAVGAQHGRGAEDEDVGHHDQAVERIAELAQPRVVDSHEHERDEQPDAGVDALALDVVERAAGLERPRGARAG